MSCPPTSSKFRNEVFISYAHLDNTPILDERSKGWVDKLHFTLNARLQQYLGRKINIWRDNKLERGGDFFDASIEEQLTNSAILVSVISPSYLDSEWCMKELIRFLDLMKGEEKEKPRVFKAVKLPVNRDQLPKVLSRILDVEFFQQQNGGKAQELFLDETDPTRKDFIFRVGDLAQDIKSRLLSMNGNGNQPGSKILKSSQKTIYLAETTSDQRKNREQIQRELEQHGHRVLPDDRGLMSSEEVQAYVKGELEKSNLSVHLIGERYGPIPEQEQSSIISLQAKWASEIASQGRLSYLVWIPKWIQPEDPRQVKYIEDLRSTIIEGPRISLMETETLQELKQGIQDKLYPKITSEKTEYQRHQSEAGTGHKPLVYFICHKSDWDQIQPAVSHLRKKNIRVNGPLFEEKDEGLVLQYLQENLTLCDALLIVYGVGSEGWVKLNLLSFQKAYGLGRPQNSQFKFKGFFMIGNTNREIHQFDLDDLTVMKQQEDFTPRIFDPLFQALGIEQ